MIRHLARDIIVWLSAFSIGTALFSAALSLRMAKSNWRRYLSFAAAKVGYALVVGTVLVRLLLPAPEVGVDGWSVAYTVGLALAGFGFVGIGRAIRREFVEWESANYEKTLKEEQT